MSSTHLPRAAEFCRRTVESAQPSRRFPCSSRSVRGRRARTPSRLAFPSVLLAVLAGCETVEVVEAPPPAPVEAPEPVEEPVAEPEVPTGEMIVRIHADSASDMPDGATGTVRLVAEGIDRASEVSKDAPLARFDALRDGRYELSVSVNSGGVEIGTFSYPIRVADSLRDVTAPINFLRGDLVVETVVKSVLDREYDGMAIIAPDGCLGADLAGAVRSDLSIAAEGDDVELTVANFQGETLRLSGRIASDSTPFSAAGTYASSDATAGTWKITYLASPTPRSVGARIEFDNQTRACRATLEFAGLADRPVGAAALGSNRAAATVEVVGHGQARTVELGPADTVARFDELLIGPYEVFIDVRRDEQTVDTYTESVVLGADGARLATAFEVDRTLARAAPLASQGEYSLANRTYEGKSVVSRGSPECTGSIALVDTARLDVTASGGTIDLTFDNFYGKVLELTGAVADADGVLAASGTYRSSDSKTGSWAIDYLAMPTPPQVATLVVFRNETDSCQATYEFSGLRR